MQHLCSYKYIESNTMFFLQVQPRCIVFVVSMACFTSDQSATRKSYSKEAKCHLKKFWMWCSYAHFICLFEIYELTKLKLLSFRQSCLPVPNVKSQVESQVPMPKSQVKSQVSKPKSQVSSLKAQVSSQVPSPNGQVRSSLMNKLNFLSEYSHSAEKR